MPSLLHSARVNNEAQRHRTNPARTRLALEQLESRTVLTVLLYEGHVHFEIGYSAGAWNLQLTDVENDIRYQPDEAMPYLWSIHHDTQQPGQEFIGAGQGNQYWRTPQPSTPGVTTLALSAADIPAGTFYTYQPRDPRVTRAGEWIRFALRDVIFFGQGPAYVSAWRDQQPLGQFWVSSYDGGRTLDPNFYIEPGDHIHYNFGFTTPGYYAIAFEASAFVGGTGLPVRSGDVYYFVAVEPPGTSPDASRPGDEAGDGRTTSAGEAGGPSSDGAGAGVVQALVVSFGRLSTDFGGQVGGDVGANDRFAWPALPRDEYFLAAAGEPSRATTPQTAPASRPADFFWDEAFAEEVLFG